MTVIKEGQLHLLNHPVLKHKLGRLRNKQTPSYEFRHLVKDMGQFLAYEATRDLTLIKQSIETPLSLAEVELIKEAPVVVSILRAGNGMLDGILEALPFASAGHIGVYRDKFIKNTVEYYFKLPVHAKGKRILLADPLIATGDTTIACLDRLKQYEVGPIRILCILASAQGIEKVAYFHPDVEIYAIAKELELNEQGYLLPGLGDAGDRLYNTK